MLTIVIMCTSQDVLRGRIHLCWYKGRQLDGCEIVNHSIKNSKFMVDSSF